MIVGRCCSSRLARAVLIAASTLVFGCTARVTPPMVVDAEAVTVYLWESGMHSGVVLPTHDGHGLSFEYGEWAWVIEDRRGWWRIFPSLFTPTGAYLMRDRIPSIHDPLVVAIAAEADRVWAFRAERELVDRLRDCLEQAFQRRIETVTIDDGRQAVAAERPYHLDRTCSRVTGIWLRRLGCSLHLEGWAWDWAVEGVEPLDLGSLDAAEIVGLEAAPPGER